MTTHETRHAQPHARPGVLRRHPVQSSTPVLGCASYDTIGIATVLLFHRLGAADSSKVGARGGWGGRGVQEGNGRYTCPVSLGSKELSLALLGRFERAPGKHRALHAQRAHLVTKHTCLTATRCCVKRQSKHGIESLQL